MNDKARIEEINIKAPPEAEGRNEHALGRLRGEYCYQCNKHIGEYEKKRPRVCGSCNEEEKKTAPLLKKCPWCGSPPAFIVDDLTGTVTVNCLNDACYIRPYSRRSFQTRRDTLAAWNNPKGKPSNLVAEKTLRLALYDALASEEIWKKFITTHDFMDIGD